MEQHRAIAAARNNAARNNATWCDAVARAAGLRTDFRESLWLNRDGAPPYYPDAVTLSAGTPAVAEQVAALAALIEASPRRPLAVKDSFGTLDLSTLGFAPLFDATWIWRDPASETVADSTWRRVGDAAGLAAWIHAWGGGEVDDGEVGGGEAAGETIFRPALLEDDAHALLGCWRDGRLVAGCVASRAAGALGISNVFGTGGDDRAARAACIAAAMAWAPGLPLAGYEADDALEAMISLGFQPIGRLRVWLRDPGAVDN